MLKVAEKYPEVDDIKADLKSLKSHANELGHHVKADGKEKMNAIAEDAQEQLHHIKDAGRKQIRSIENYVVENPVQSLAYAFVGGIVASLVLGRR